MGSFISRVLAIIVAVFLLVIICVAVMSTDHDRRERTNQQVVSPEPLGGNPSSEKDAAVPSDPDLKAKTDEAQAAIDGARRRLEAAAGETKSSFADSSNKPSGEDWADSASAVRQADIEVRIVGVAVRFVTLEAAFSGESKSKDRLLMIRLAIANTSNSRKIDFEGWGAKQFDVDRRSRGSLEDERHNVYKRCHFGIGTKVVGQVQEPESLYPGKSLSDVLVFEPPVAGFSALYLELPAEMFGGSGKLRFKIAKSSITDDAKADEEAAQEESAERERAEIVAEIKERTAEFKRRLDFAKAGGAGTELFSRIEREMAEYQSDVARRLAKIPKSKAEKEAEERKREADDKVAQEKMDRTFQQQQEDGARRAADEEAKWRTWTTADGKHSVEAKFLSAAGGNVKLEKRDGSTLTIAKDKLSDGDLKWIKDLAAFHGIKK